MACNEKCGGVLTDPIGVITSPNFPYDYNNNERCTWVINAPEGSRINVNITDFAMEYHVQCRHDYLEIFNGPNFDSSSIGKFCGTAPPDGFKSQTHSVSIFFFTDAVSSARGFNLTYTFSIQAKEDTKKSRTIIKIAASSGGGLLMIVTITIIACACKGRKKRKRDPNAVQLNELQSSNSPQEWHENNRVNVEGLPDDDNYDVIGPCEELVNDERKCDGQGQTNYSDFELYENDFRG
ncbi:hypothetical protein DPMN_103275 [Dreissena polymorpha]|uniref:CUB domain-containing protein n=2 Tax=Dreissena polymorpha TaxID=45954 RepID=A0A9D4H9Q8_DREPO|nr:hypothetical protein DPMN_103275 [Dreissena polymorpha]